MSSAKSSAKKKITVKYKKVTGASGYQIAYQKSGSKKWTYTTVSSKSASKTLTKLTSKKNYKVKVRAYKTVSGKKYYGTYSATKTVKVK
ncbi:MAG: fibronectin type III domain-containing protein [Coprobacillus sp.]|nr:fibronectin type III domain-containing protein [Coprobacillus sp.]